MTVNTATKQRTQYTQYTPDIKDIAALVYRLQLAGVLVYLVRGSIVTRGAEEPKALNEVKRNEAEIIRYIENTSSQYWMLYTIDARALPLRFKEPVALEYVKSINRKIISAMPCEYEPGLFDMDADEVQL